VTASPPRPAPPAATPPRCAWAVSKTWPRTAVRELAVLGQADFGENRAQELTAKARS
jgi:hypothetical protein